VLAVLTLASYGSIAIGRAYFIEVLHQSIVRQAAQLRYHYPATPLIAIALAVSGAAVFTKRLAVWAPAALIAWLTVSAILYARTGWTIRNYDGERQRAERILARIDAAIRDTPAGEPVVTYNEGFVDGGHISGAASLYVMMNRHEGSRPVYFVDRGAVGIYRAFPGSPLAGVVLPPPMMKLACARFTLQSESE
jgi:hypothetical protein